MDHVVIPLDADHVASVETLAEAVAGVADVIRPDGGRPHVTLAAYTDIDDRTAHTAVAVAVAVAGIHPFVVRAHGYGIFTGDEPSGLNLHVPVVRTAELDALHELVVAALRGAGATIAGWTETNLWTPHITLLDRGLDATGLGAGIAVLAERHHPRWQLRVDRVAVAGGWPQRARRWEPILFGDATAGTRERATDRWRSPVGTSPGAMRGQA